MRIQTDLPNLGTGEIHAGIDGTSGVVAGLLSLCPTAGGLGGGIGSARQTQGQAAAQKVPEADSGNDGWADE